MKLHRILAMLLALCLLLSACGGVAGPAETEAPTTEATEPPVETKAQEDPEADGVLKVLLIGNSFSCGFAEELNGMLRAAKVKAKIYSVYYSSCTLRQHFSWNEVGQRKYRLRHYVQNTDTNTDFNDVNLQFCMDAENWDVIALQQHFDPILMTDVAEAKEESIPYAQKLFDLLKVNFPKSKLVWYETWVYDVGWEGGGFVIDEAMQTQSQSDVRTISQQIAEENGVPMVPCGGAWNIARTQYDMGEMTRGDKCHDGTTTGGQYLNACVWFECLTGQSCVGNPWRPTYQYDEGRWQQFQEIAHKANEENPLKPDTLK